MCLPTRSVGGYLERAYGVLAVTNDNPYWRLAYAHDWGANSIMVGTYGMVGNAIRTT